MDFSYTITRKKIKNVYIQIKDGNVLVKAPYRVQETEIENIVKEKRKWIEKQLQKKESRVKKDVFTLLGVDYEIERKTSEKNEMELCGSKAIVYLSEPKLEEKVKKQFYLEQAKKQYIKTTQKMMQETGLSPDAWRIRDIKSAWGSCSSKRMITLSLNLVKKREEIIEYVVLHELCHLKHMNHSQSFWGLVGKYMPEYKTYRKELKKSEE